MEHEVTLELQQGSQEFSGVVKGNSGFLLSHCRGIGPHLDLMQGPGFHFEMWLLLRNSGLLSSCDGELGDPLELP